MFYLDTYLFKDDPRKLVFFDLRRDFSHMDKVDEEAFPDALQHLLDRLGLHVQDERKHAIHPGLDQGLVVGVSLDQYGERNHHLLPNGEAGVSAVLGQDRHQVICHQRGRCLEDVLQDLEGGLADKHGLIQGSLGEELNDL